MPQVLSLRGTHTFNRTVPVAGTQVKTCDLPKIRHFTGLSTIQETSVSPEVVQELKTSDQEFTGVCWEKDEQVQKAISESVPVGDEDWEECIFRFCRKLKAIEELKSAPNEILRPISEKWCFECLAGKEPESTDFAWSSFVFGWERVLYPEGETFLKALELANTVKELPPQQERYEDEKVLLLLRLCFQLQQLREDKNSFFLSFQDAGEVIGYSHTWGGKLLNMFVKDGVLEIVEKHVFGPDVSRRATIYRFIEQQTQ